MGSKKHMNMDAMIEENHLLTSAITLVMSLSNSFDRTVVVDEVYPLG
jgi:hypothetical protein